MDWAKAKTILIIALLATNLFLIASMGLGDNPKSSNEEALLRILEERNIYVEGDIPEYRDSLPILRGEYIRCDEEETALMMSLQPVLPVGATDEEYEEAACDFLEYMGLLDENVVFDCIEKDGSKTTVIFKNEVLEMTLQGSIMSCIFENGKMKDFEYLWLDQTGFSQKKAEIISPSVALMSVTNENLETAMIIKEIEMIYWTPEMTDEEIALGETLSDTAFPAWKISTADGEEFIVEAVQL